MLDAAITDVTPIPGGADAATKAIGKGAIGGHQLRETATKRPSGAPRNHPGATSWGMGREAGA